MYVYGIVNHYCNVCQRYVVSRGQTTNFVQAIDLAISACGAFCRGSYIPIDKSLHKIVVWLRETTYVGG